MTAMAVAIPLGWSYPALLPLLTGVVLLIAWARLALGHHYLSDVVAGALLGSGIAIPVCAWLLSLG